MEAMNIENIGGNKVTVAWLKEDLKFITWFAKFMMLSSLYE